MLCQRAMPAFASIDMAAGQDTLAFKLACYLVLMGYRNLADVHFRAPNYTSLNPPIRGNQSSDCRAILHRRECLAGDKPCQPYPCFLSWAAGRYLATARQLSTATKTTRHRAFSMITEILQFSNQTCGLLVLQGGSHNPTCIGIARYMIRSHTSTPKRRLTWGLLAVLKRPQAYAMEMWR